VSFNLAPPLAGDFNFDGSVDAADYVVWRKGLGTTYLPDHYDVWSGNFGMSSPGSAAQHVAIPEATTWRLLFVAALSVALSLRERNRPKTPSSIGAWRFP
jgi:hypothetical protein